MSKNQSLLGIIRKSFVYLIYSMDKRLFHIDENMGKNEIKAEMELFKIFCMVLAGIVFLGSYEVLKGFLAGSDIRIPSIAICFVSCLAYVVTKQYSRYGRRLDELEKDEK